MSTHGGDARFHHLDALRAAALLLGILLHAVGSYLPGVREANYPLADASNNVGLGLVFYVIHMFRMVLFFLIAGFFARLLHQRLGTRGLIKNRLRRIGLPLIVFMILCMPLIVIAFIWGARQLGIKAGSAPLVIPMIGPPVPWGHLWFLYTLLVILLLVMAVRAVLVRMDTDGGLRARADSLLAWGVRTRLAPVLLALPLGLSLFYAPWWVQWQGIPSPVFGLVPNLPSVIAYGSAFLAGWFLHRQLDLLQTLARDAFLYLALAAICTVVSLWAVGVTPRMKVVEMDAATRVLFVASYMLGLWCWTFGLLGLAARMFRAASPRWRYLADASYWMYVMHLPVVMLLQAWMLSWSLHWSIKLSLVLGITGIVLLGSYHYLVRSTFVGVFLNGRRYPRGVSLPAVAAG